MLQQKNSVPRLIVSVVVCTALIAGSLGILIYKQQIIDQIAVWRFSPSVGISALSNRIDFSSNGEFMFYASQPQLDKSNEFNQVCKSIENTTSILGCYSNYQIHIYDVTDEKLDGIKEVTAAHEMLHAVYQRMNDVEREKIDKLLETEYNKMLDNEAFVDLIRFYTRTEPGERSNELHSIIGTMVLNINPELESHYAKYFKNRKTVVDFYDKYNGVFKDLNDRAKVLSDQLNQLAINIPAKSEQYNLSVQKLNADIKAFNIRAEGNDFTSQYQFNIERTALETRVTSVNDMKTSINSDIDSYNSMLNEYNSITAESKQLYNSMDSTLVEAPSV